MACLAWVPLLAQASVDLLRTDISVAGAASCAWKPGPATLTLNANATALTVWNDGGGNALFAGGAFTSAGGVTANRIARWNGTSWSPLSGPSGNGTSGAVSAITVFDAGNGPALYAAGNFLSAGGVAVNRIARWDGTRWHPLQGPQGTGVNDEVRAMVVFDDGSGPALYVAGRFTSAGGVPATYIARWNGSEWSALPTPSGSTLNGSIRTLAVADLGGGPSLFAGGLFTQLGSMVLNGVVRWNGQTWSALPGPQGTGVEVGSIWALFPHHGPEGNALYAGGSFAFAGGIQAFGVARWSGSRWWPMSGPNGNGVNTFGANVETFGEFSDGVETVLYAGGSFDTAGGLTVNRIARWNGVRWSGLPGTGATGTNGPVLAMAAFADGIETGPVLYVGGGFTTAGGAQASGIARWWCPTIEPPPEPACVDIGIEGPSDGLIAATPSVAGSNSGYEVVVSNLGTTALENLGVRVDTSGLSNLTWGCVPEDSCQPSAGAGQAQTAMSLGMGGEAVLAVAASVDLESHFVEIDASVQVGPGYEWLPGCRTRANLIHPAGPGGVFKSRFE